MTEEIDGAIDGFQPFWDAAASGELRFPACRSCERFHWYPMPRCPHCGGPGISWEAVDSAGSIYSWTIVSRAFDAAFADRIPYIVALIEFSGAPGVRLITNLIDIAANAVEFGMPVSPAFDLYERADPRLMFRPFDESDGVAVSS